MLEDLRSRLARFGRLGWCTLVTAALYLTLSFAAPNSTFTSLARLLLLGCLFVWLVRLSHAGLRKAIWSLRNRLLVTYLFIAVVPVLLIGTLALMAAWTIGTQVALYLATSELERREAALRFAAATLARVAPKDRAAAMEGMGKTVFESQFPGIVFLASDGTSTIRWPDESTAIPPPGGKDDSGIAVDGESTYLFAKTFRNGTTFAARAPLTPRFLAGLVPGLLVSLVDTGVVLPSDTFMAAPSPGFTQGQIRLKPSPAGAAQRLPAPVNRFDIQIGFFVSTRVASWDATKPDRNMLLYIRTRPSLLLDILTRHTLGETSFNLLFVLVGIAVLFVIVELIALAIGVSLTRTVTRAVHELYRGTQKVIEGDFSHRIPVHRNDQLGELTTSFNVMTGNVERLLAVAKEKERLQAELEIAREVQNQLYPRVTPATPNLRLAAFCKPARTVSGDYYDYQALDERHVAISIGDVAGKGISAALLMATLQSSVRAQTRSAMEHALTQPRADRECISTSHLVDELNRQLHAFTSPEKYATFCFGIYDDDKSTLCYTNAGHLPPMLIREGAATPLDVNGMVVGAFPFAKYDESRIELRSGDLLLFYTDGVTEPENAYGEMFGEQRLIDLVRQNVSRPEEEIIRNVIEAVEQWAGAVEQFDDMTLMLARRQ
jgi:sigma-B regulation protein RsbU (phosphoserine phosphatase)